MVTHLDVYPTICELAGIEPPDWLEGTSLMPLVRGERAAIHDEIFTEMTYHAAYQPQRAIRTERWKYIRRFDDDPHPVLANCDDSASKDLLVEHGWAPAAASPRSSTTSSSIRTRGATSPREPENAAVLAELRRRLEAGWTSAGDPLLEGPVAPPPGAEINDPNQISPAEPTTHRRRSERIPRPRHPGDAEPLARARVGGLGVERAVLEGAQPAVERPQLPHPRHLSRAELALEEAVDEEEAQEDPVADGEDAPVRLGEQLALQPLDPLEDGRERLAAGRRERRGRRGARPSMPTSGAGAAPRP